MCSGVMENRVPLKPLLTGIYSPANDIDVMFQ